MGRTKKASAWTGMSAGLLGPVYVLVRDVNDFSGRDRSRYIRQSIDETIQKRDSRQNEGKLRTSPFKLQINMVGNKSVTIQFISIWPMMLVGSSSRAKAFCNIDSEIAVWGESRARERWEGDARRAA